MVGLLRLSMIGACITGAAITAFVSLPNSTQSVVVAQQAPQDDAPANFPDTQNHWAQPFISALAQRNIVNGYPDGSYRPTRPVERDEFAAIIRKAFEQESERQIASGSVYRDVPEGYWAEQAIQEAYEMGFMRGYPDKTFRPRQSVTRVEALTSLARNLELSQRVPSTPQAARTGTQVNQAQAAPSATPRQRARRRIVFPIAALGLMQPLMRVPAATATQAAPTTQKAAAASVPKSGSTQVPAKKTLSSYYNDADRIPQYAIDPMAAVTRAGIVVNYPNQRLLNPNQPASRADIAAFIHQALVNKGQLPPLADNVGAAKYVVGREAMNSNNPSQNNQSRR